VLDFTMSAAPPSFAGRVGAASNRVLCSCGARTPPKCVSRLKDDCWRTGCARRAKRCFRHEWLDVSSSLGEGRSVLLGASSHNYPLVDHPLVGALARRGLGDIRPFFRSEIAPLAESERGREPFPPQEFASRGNSDEDEGGLRTAGQARDGRAIPQLRHIASQTREALAHR
jgi:hypothetical protein